MKLTRVHSPCTCATRQRWDFPARKTLALAAALWPASPFSPWGHSRPACAHAWAAASAPQWIKPAARKNLPRARLRSAPIRSAAALTVTIRVVLLLEFTRSSHRERWGLNWPGKRSKPTLLAQSSSLPP
jgi:hypothetical protein